MPQIKIKKSKESTNLRIEETVLEIKDYFNTRKEEDYLEFDEHPLATIENLMDPDSPAPWDEDEEDLV